MHIFQKQKQKQMPINVKRDEFTPDERSPIIHKDVYNVPESDIGYLIPVNDKDGGILYYRECTEEEYLIWYNLLEDGEI